MNQTLSINRSVTGSVVVVVPHGSRQLQVHYLTHRVHDRLSKSSHLNGFTYHPQFASYRRDGRPRSTDEYIVGIEIFRNMGKA